MSLRLYFFILLVIFITRGLSVGLLYFYMNPLNNPNLSLSLMGIGIFLAMTSFLAPFLYFFKKIYYRGDVNISTMHASLRQGILLTTAVLFLGVLFLFQIREWQVFATAIATILCIEVMFQALS